MVEQVPNAWGGEGKLAAHTVKRQMRGTACCALQVRLRTSSVITVMRRRCARQDTITHIGEKEVLCWLVVLGVRRIGTRVLMVIRVPCSCTLTECRMRFY